MLFERILFNTSFLGNQGFGFSFLDFIRLVFHLQLGVSFPKVIQTSGLAVAVEHLARDLKISKGHTRESKNHKATQQCQNTLPSVP